MIDRFDDLLRVTTQTDFAPLYAALEGGVALERDRVLPDDRVYPRGTRAYGLATRAAPSSI